MPITKFLLAALLCILSLHSPHSSQAETRYDVAIIGGRVIDPGSGFDAVANVGVRDGRIAIITEQELSADQLIPAGGLVVAPGFVDLHTHSLTPLGQRYQLLDGVTTALELEAGTYPLDGLEALFPDGARINYGSSAGHGSVRVQAMLGIQQVPLLTGKPEPVNLKGYWTLLRGLLGLSTDDAFVKQADQGQRETMRALLQDGLDNGALGIGVPLDYFSVAVNEQELRMLFDTAAETNNLLYIHVRRGINGDPAGLREALRLAKESGAAVHICHIQHNAMRNIELFLQKIREARAQGVDVTTETLPYNAGSALISSAVFGRDWRTIFNIDYPDVEWAATGMRFTEDTWNEYREKHPGGQVVHHYLKEEWTQRAIREPGVIVVSDLLPMVNETRMVAPHNNAFAKVLGRYVRETPLLDLPTMLAKMTWLPAKRLQAFYPLFERKGRIQEGADADITVFDPATVIDRATYGNPFQASAGIQTVLVNGQIAVTDGKVVEDVYAGTLLRASAGER